MNKNNTSDNINKNDIHINNEECEYKNLINRLSEISSIIAILEKKYMDKS